MRGLGLGLGFGSAIKAGKGSSLYSIAVKTDNTGPSTDTQFVLPLDGVSAYNFDWVTSDGQSGTHTANTDLTFNFSTAGTYIIKIGGTNNTLPRTAFVGLGDAQKVIAHLNWGDIVWTDVSGMFNGCSNMVYQSADAPDLSLCTNFLGMFLNCTSILSLPIESWDVSTITSFSSTFQGMTALQTLCISTWDVSAAIFMQNTFKDLTSLASLDVSTWNTISLTDTRSTFEDVPVSVDISTWDFEDVTTAADMFLGSGFNTADYNLFLISLGSQNLQSGVPFHAGTAKYTEGAVDFGTTDGTTASKLIDSTQNFLTTVTVNDIIHNTTDDTFAKVTNVDSDTALSLDADIMITGETYVVQGSDPAKGRARTLSVFSWVITDGGAI